MRKYKRCVICRHAAMQNADSHRWWKTCWRAECRTELLRRNARGRGVKTVVRPPPATPPNEPPYLGLAHYFAHGLPGYSRPIPPDVPMDEDTTSYNAFAFSHLD